MLCPSGHLVSALISRIRSRPSNAHTHPTQETGVFNFSGSLCTVAHLHTLRLAAAQTARIDDCSADVEAAACCAAFLWVAGATNPVSVLFPNCTLARWRLTKQSEEADSYRIFIHHNYISQMHCFQKLSSSLIIVSHLIVDI